MRLIKYSEKCYAVQGNTKPSKDKLKAMGGKFNPHLKGGAGWIFPLKKEAELKAFISTPDYVQAQEDAATDRILGESLIPNHLKELMNA